MAPTVRRIPANPACEKIRIEQHGSIGLLRIAGWLFTIGYLQLSFWQGLPTPFVWPYFIGQRFTPLPH